MLKLKLGRDLRKNLLRGHPWVYSQALESKPKASQAQMGQVLDKKGQSVGWALYDPHSPLALRILSLESKPPPWGFFEKRLERAKSLREGLFGDFRSTNAYRLINGEGDGLPGFVCDVYGDLAVIQFDGQGPFEFWDKEALAQWLLGSGRVRGVFYKPRKSDKTDSLEWGDVPSGSEVLVKENGLSFWVNFRDGQKTGFFLDQRDNRQYLSQWVRGKTLANFFSYTGGFSVYGGAGGARDVVSIDLSKPALDLAQKSWTENDFKGASHQTHAVDIFDYLKQSSDRYDVVVVDPPSLTHSESNKSKAVKNYVDIFGKCSRLVAKEGHLFLSSCSSHISFQDFFEIINESLSASRRRGRILRVSGQGADHPFPHICPELRYLKFVHLHIDG